MPEIKPQFHEPDGPYTMREIANELGMHRRRVAAAWRMLRTRYPEVADLVPVDERKPISIPAAGASRLARYFQGKI